MPSQLLLQAELAERQLSSAAAGPVLARAGGRLPLLERARLEDFGAGLELVFDLTDGVVESEDLHLSEAVQQQQSFRDTDLEDLELLQGLGIEEPEPQELAELHQDESDLQSESPPDPAGGGQLVAYTPRRPACPSVVRPSYQPHHRPPVRRGPDISAFRDILENLQDRQRERETQDLEQSLVALQKAREEIRWLRGQVDQLQLALSEEREHSTILQQQLDEVLALALAQQVGRVPPAEEPLPTPPLTPPPLTPPPLTPPPQLGQAWQRLRDETRFVKRLHSLLTPELEEDLAWSYQESAASISAQENPLSLEAALRGARQHLADLVSHKGATLAQLSELVTADRPEPSPPEWLWDLDRPEPLFAPDGRPAYITTRLPPPVPPGTITRMPASVMQSMLARRLINPFSEEPPKLTRQGQRFVSSPPPPPPTEEL